MRKVQKKPACVTRCKRGDPKIHKKPNTRSVAAIRMANTRAKKVAHKKKKQVSNVRAQAKKALQQERPYTPNTEDAKLKKIAADVRRVVKKVDNADKKSDAATATADRCHKTTKHLLERNLTVEARQEQTDRHMQSLEMLQATAEQRFERRMEGTEQRLQDVERITEAIQCHRRETSIDSPALW